MHLQHALDGVKRAQVIVENDYVFAVCQIENSDCFVQNSRANLLFPTPTFW
jgi:hypothetical protein